VSISTEASRIAELIAGMSLEEKLALARNHGLEPYVVTQFSFAPNRVAEYCADLARRAPATSYASTITG